MAGFYFTYKSIFSPWGWGKKIDFQAIWDIKFLIPDIHKQLF